MTTTKPEKREATVSYWWCGVRRCRTKHETKAVAAKCVKRRTSREQIATIARERRQEIFKLRSSGMKLKDIGEKFGISASRASQLSDMAEREILGWRAYSKKHWPELSQREADLEFQRRNSKTPGERDTFDAEHIRQLDALFDSKGLDLNDYMRHFFICDLPLEEISQKIDAVLATRASIGSTAE